MSLSFVKISPNWVQQPADHDDSDEAEVEGVNILHRNNPRRWDQCTCQRCMSYRYKRGIRDLKRELGREPDHLEVADRWNQIQRDAGLI